MKLQKLLLASAILALANHIDATLFPSEPTTSIETQLNAREMSLIFQELEPLMIPEMGYEFLGGHGNLAKISYKKWDYQQGKHVPVEKLVLFFLANSGNWPLSGWLIEDMHNPQYTVRNIEIDDFSCAKHISPLWSSQFRTKYYGTFDFSPNCVRWYWQPIGINWETDMQLVAALEFTVDKNGAITFYEL